MSHILFNDGTSKSVSFHVKNTTWLCGIIFANINRYGNIISYFQISNNEIETTPIIGSVNEVLNITIDNGNLILTFINDSYSFRDIVLIYA